MVLNCPKCGATADSVSEADEKFGRRTTASGREKWQSWCRACRTAERTAAYWEGRERPLTLAQCQNALSNFQENELSIPEKLDIAHPDSIRELWAQEYPNDKQSRSINTMRKRLQKRYARNSRN